MNYRFDKIAFNSTAKKTPTESDKEHYIGLEHIDSECLEITRWGSDVAPIGEKLIMKKGDVLFGKRRAYQRKLAIAPFDGIFSAHGMVLRPNEEVVDKNYFPFFMSSDLFMERAVQISVGGLSPTINWKDLREQEFPLPSLAEQKVLAEKLWAAYRLKESYKKLLAATEEMVKSQFIEMFGDNVSKKKISDVCDVRGGSTPTRTTKEFWNNGTISWFTIEDIYEQGRYISETKQHITELATKKCFVYPVDTVLICCTASVGEYAITKKEMASNQQFNGMMIKDKSELHPEYLLYVASTLKEDLLRQAGKTTINFVSRSKLENIEIPVPPYSEQLGFVSVYRQADKSGFDELKSQFIEMFGDPLKNPKNYTQRKLGDVATLLNGRAYKASELLSSGRYLVLRVGNFFTNTDYYYSDLELEPDKYCDTGDILYSWSATLGAQIWKGGKVIYHYHIWKVLFDENILNKEYFCFMLNVMTDSLKQETHGSTMVHLTKDGMEKKFIAIPPLELQRRFVSIAEQADKSGSVLQYMIAC